MKVSTPEISWHGKEAIFSIDIQCKLHKQPQRIATASLDSNVRVSFIIVYISETTIFTGHLSLERKS